ncbi:MAG: fatty acid desaturase family protein [Planctomycetota bacterium]|nr:fatty acid desaturase family protein [Planctomycetota bacterium]
MKVELSTEKVRELSRLSTARGLWAVGVEWLGIALSIGLCEMMERPLWLIILTVIWIGARLHGLGVLLHEATHHRLAKSRWLNEVLGDLFCAFPIGVSLASYRANHLAHHQFTNTDKDPDSLRKKSADWVFPKPPSQIFMLFLRDALGMNVIGHLRGVREMSGNSKLRSRRSKLRLIAYLSIVALAIATETWPLFLLYWLLPTISWLQVVLRLRSMAEHFGLGVQGPSATRTTYASFFERLFLAPHNVGYHLDHHLFPSVPAYRLPELHKQLLEVPAFQEGAHRSPSYWAVLKECSGGMPAKLFSSGGAKAQ